VSDAIQKEISNRGGSAAVNVKIEQQVSVVQLILGGITGGIYVPATLHITGSVVK
jgi:hypothetical protein